MITARLKLKRTAHKARQIPGPHGPAQALKAWWYERENGIDVYLQPASGEALACRINRTEIIKWIKRTGQW